jgi:competence ComEA-like helix-hairpin-helix protein
MSGTATSDWTFGPAKWAIVVLLGAASIAGMAWSIAYRRPLSLRNAPVQLAPAGAVATAPAQPGRVILREETDGPPTSPKLSRPPAALTAKLNINTATAAELELLPGIGPALAGRIIEDRTAAGPFRSVEDLDRVKGIGPKTMDRLRELIAVE